jgi:outer membrane protein assembly factor BamD
MIRRARNRCVAAAFAFVAGALSVEAAVVWREAGGWTVEGTPSEADTAAQPGFNEAAAAEKAGNAGRAIDGYRAVVKRHPTSEFAAIAQFKVGELQEKEGNVDRAFEAYQALVENYPRSTDFERAVESMYTIANRFLGGEKQKLLGLPTLPSMERAQKMSEAIVKSAPFSKYAALSQFNIGLAMERQGQIPQAVEAYQQVIERYPTSDVADDAQYQIGYVYLKQAREGSYDQAAAQKARDAFSDFSARYPSSEKLPQARENLKLLEGRKTQGAIEIARFYDKQKNYKAAAIYYNEVLLNEAGSAQSDQARERLDEIRSLVGEEALNLGPEKPETAARAKMRRRLQAQVDTSARADFVGPPAPPVPDELPEAGPQMRTSPADVLPLPPVEPPLPQ